MSVRASPAAPAVLHSPTSGPPNLVAEGLISLTDASAVLPPLDGKSISVSAIWRWIVYGKRGVFLEGTQLVGGLWWTTRPALERFAQALTQQSQGQRKKPQR